MHDSPLPRRPYWLCFIVVALAGIAPRPALADVTAAARAFARGQEAQLEGDYAVAAEHFELAFGLQPSKEALRSAARMQMSAKNFARAATHAQSLLDLFAEDAQSTELARSILEDVAPGLAKYEVSCTPECGLSVDQRAYFIEPARTHRLYLKPGRVAFEAHFAGGRTASRIVTTSAGETTHLDLLMPASPASPTSPASSASNATSATSTAQRDAPRRSLSRDAAVPRGTSSGVPAMVPWLTGAATLASGGLTLWAALDTRQKHQDYVDHPTEEGWSNGVARQRLTNILAASTAALGVATITLAFFVRDSTKPSVGVTPSLSPSSAALDIAGKF